MVPASVPAISAPYAAEQATPWSRPLSMASGMPSPALADSDPAYGCEDDHDLHPLCAEQDPQRDEKPAGFLMSCGKKIKK